MTGVPVKIVLTGLPVHELRTYRLLRQRGFTRSQANMVIYGRFMLHQLGTVEWRLA